MKKSEEPTWRKIIAGLPKHVIRDHYKHLWPTLRPQLKDRYVLFRAFFWDKKQKKWNGVIIRHPPGRPDEFIHIRSFAQLLPYIKAHAVEVVPEIQKIKELPDLTVTQFLEMDIKGAPSRVIKAVARDIFILFGGPSEKITIVDTGGKGFHFYRKLKQPMDINEARKIMNFTRETIHDKWERRIPGLIELNIQKAKRRRTGIFLDISSLKRHGAARAIGSIHWKTHRIARKISLAEVK